LLGVNRYFTKIVNPLALFGLGSSRFTLPLSLEGTPSGVSMIRTFELIIGGCVGLFLFLEVENVYIDFALYINILFKNKIF
jgi:hypothetical protein